MSGGTGGGLGSYIIENLPKKTNKLNINMMSQESPLEFYNSALYMKNIDNIDT